ncbi:thiamine-phosphate kinase [candidate division KSB1 bacterium]|nr:thiamine-phosphate kinase [candidate division KSB1 bacterium]
MELSELELIEKIKRWVGQRHRGVVVGPGDDAAAFQTQPGLLTLVTSDTLIEGIHFNLDYISFYQLGWKAMAVNLSDIAAMGGKPHYALVSLSIPDRISSADIEELYRGMEDLNKRFDVKIVGGDITGSKNDFVLCVTITGGVEEARLATRSGAVTGDIIGVTGTLGGSKAGQMLLESKQRVEKASKEYRTSNAECRAEGSKNRQNLIKKHLMPFPRIEEASLLVENFMIHAMIDISDGLASEVNHLCQESGTGAEIYAKAIPLMNGMEQTARKFSNSPLDYALSGGEDYELLFVMDYKDFAKAGKLVFDNTGTALTKIGEMVPKEKGVRLLVGTKHVPLTQKGFDHFKKGVSLDR